MDAHREFPDEPQPRWYGGDAGWESRGPDASPDDAGYRIPEPRGGDGSPRSLDVTAESRFAAVDPRLAPDPPFGARYPDVDSRYPEVDPRGAAPDRSFPGFAPPRSQPDPLRTDLNAPPLSLSPSAYPVLSSTSAPPAADPAATAERPRSMDPPTGPISSVPPRFGGPGGVMEDGPRFPAEPVDRPAPRRSGPAEPVGDGVYRTRRPAVAVLFLAVAAVLEVPALLLLIEGATGDVVAASPVVAGALLMLGLPAFALGLYALVTGAGRSPGQSPAKVWLRPPLAYLAIGLVLFVAAGLAAG